MKKIIYQVNQRPAQKLIFGHRYDHNNLTIEFAGVERTSKNSTVYVKIGYPVEVLVPISDSNAFTVQSYITKQAQEKIPCQLVEYKLKESSTNEYELISNSDIFFGTVLPSLDESKTPEVTDPSLDLIYTQMHEMYLTIKSAYESGELKGDKGDTGDKGQDGYTPIKGTDYWTDTDKQEIVDDTVEAVQPAIDAETQRATKAELELSNNVNNKADKTEVNRLIETEKTERQNAYSDLSTNIVNEATVRESADKALEKKITDEVTTARAAEQANANAISDEITRAKAAESKNAEAITSEVTRAKAAENVLQSNIDAEAKTRKEVDSALETKVSDEVSRAKAAEQTNSTAITTEVTRAKAAESANSTAIEAETKARKEADTALETKVSDEVKTARESETTLQGNIDTLETKISDEVIRAKTAEQTNTNAITTEVTRAETAENTLQSNIDAETKARENADNALETKISDTDSKKVGYQEVSGNTLYMYTDSTKAVLLATLELPAAPVQDVQINGSSIVSNGVATVPMAKESKPGVVGVYNHYGVGLTTSNNLYALAYSRDKYAGLAANAFIAKSTLNNIQQSYVDNILCSTDESKALTTEQQIAARERIGAAKSGEWELLRDYTFNESRTGGIQINTDEDGNTFELRKYFYQLITPASVSGNVYFYMDYIAADGITKKALNQTIGDALQASKTVYSAVWYDGLLYGRCGANQGAFLQNMLEKYQLPGITPKGIRIYSSVNDTIPTGTRILLYGIRK